MQSLTQVDNSYAVFKRLMSYVKPYWLILTIGIISTILVSGVDAFAVYLTKPFVNDGFIARKSDFIEWLPVMLFVAFAIRGASVFSSSYCMTWVARTVVMNLRQAMFRHYQKIPAKFYDKSSSGLLLSNLLYDIEQVANVSTDAVLQLLESVTKIVGLSFVMLMISVKLTLLFLTIVPIIAMIIKVSNRRIRTLSLRVQKQMGRLTEVAEESIEAFRDVRIYNASQYEVSRFDDAAMQCRRGDIKSAMARAASSASIQLIAATLIAGIIYLTIKPGGLFTLTAGGFAAFLIAMLSLLKPLKQFSNLNSNIHRGVAGAASVFALYDSEVEPDNGKQQLSHCKGDIQFQDVSFAYDDKMVLNNIKLHIKAGETIAFVGHSGSGKTTLVHLFARFYEISSGKIILDDIDTQHLRLDNLREHIAYVGQHVTLFNGTVADNIAYGLGDKVRHQDIERAAKLAHADEFIQRLPERYDALIGDNGVLLSGGQRQRIALARAILKDASVLILDEATSALDTESERYIQDAMQTVSQGRTTLVIAHRLSTIENADRIVVLDKGQIVEVGSHEQLIQKGSYYARLHALQVQSVSAPSEAEAIA